MACPVCRVDEISQCVELGCYQKVTLLSLAQGGGYEQAARSLYVRSPVSGVLREPFAEAVSTMRVGDLLLTTKPLSNVSAKTPTGRIPEPD